MRLRGRGEPVGAARSNFFVDLPRRSTYESMSDHPQLDTQTVWVGLANYRPAGLGLC